MLKFFRIISGFLFIIQGKVNSLTEDFKATRHALCILFPDSNSGVNGVVSFSQEHIMQKQKIGAAIRGLKPNSYHGIHIQEMVILVMVVHVFLIQRTPPCSCPNGLKMRSNCYKRLEKNQNR